MTAVYAWLRKHRSVNLLLVASYAGFILFAHEWFVHLSVDVMNRLSLEVYDRLVAVMALIGAAALIFLTIYLFRTRKTTDTRGFAFFGLSILGLVTHYFVFMEMNIEFIHALEFGVLSALILPLVKRFGAAIIVTLPFMLLDEWYQYIVLFEWVEYLDFNDILLDLLGCGLALSLLRLMGVGERFMAPPLLHRPEFLSLLVFSALLVGALISGLIVPYTHQASGNTWLVLSTINPNTPFWRVHPLIGSTYHVLSPISGMVVMLGTAMTYLGLDAPAQDVKDI